MRKSEETETTVKSVIKKEAYRIIRFAQRKAVGLGYWERCWDYIRVEFYENTSCFMYRIYQAAVMLMGIHMLNVIQYVFTKDGVKAVRHEDCFIDGNFQVFTYDGVPVCKFLDLYDVVRSDSVYIIECEKREEFDDLTFMARYAWRYLVDYVFFAFGPPTSKQRLEANKNYVPTHTIAFGCLIASMPEAEKESHEEWKKDFIPAFDLVKQPAMKNVLRTTDLDAIRFLEKKLEN